MGEEFSNFPKNCGQIVKILTMAMAKIEIFREKRYMVKPRFYTIFDHRRPSLTIATKEIPGRQ